MRKVSMGYTTPTDEIFQESGKIIGTRVFFDENKFITGIAAVMKVNNARTESKIFGTLTSSEQRWECP
jgi:hypothetical protein